LRKDPSVYLSHGSYYAYAEYVLQEAFSKYKQCFYAIGHINEFAVGDMIIDV